MTVVISRLPPQWRNKECVKHLQEFLHVFLCNVLEKSTEIMRKDKRMISESLVRVGLTKMGWSLRMGRMVPQTNGTCVTQTCVQKAISDSNVSVKKEVRHLLRMFAQQLVNALVQNATPFKTSIKSEPSVVIRKLRLKMLSQNNN